MARRFVIVQAGWGFFKDRTNLLVDSPVGKIEEQQQVASLLEKDSAWGFAHLWFGRVLFLTFSVWCLSVIVTCGTGCSTAPAFVPTVVPTWELANAAPFEPLPVGKARVSFDRPLPAHLVQELSPEYALITIRNQKDWADVRRKLRLPEPPPVVDLSKGLIVGIQADVGQRADGQWPLRLRCVRCLEGEGSVEATFAPGIYYPLLCPGYVELVYAPTLRMVTRVVIGDRKFLIRTPTTLH